MWQRRRSWFERPRWWVAYLLYCASTAPVVMTLGWLGAPALSWGEITVFSVALPVVATWRDQRDHRAWEQLEMSSTATRAELEAAEAVVRYNRSSADPVVLREGLRIAELARGGSGPAISGLIVPAVVAAVLVMVAVAFQVLWPLPVAVVGLLLAGWAVRWTRTLDRRVTQLQEQLAAMGLPHGR